MSIPRHLLSEVRCIHCGKISGAHSFLNGCISDNRLTGSIYTPPPKPYFKRGVGLWSDVWVLYTGRGKGGTLITTGHSLTWMQRRLPELLFHKYISNHLDLTLRSVK